MSELIRDLEITGLVHGGRGIGRHQGKAVFVPLTVPGDRVDCRVVKSKRRFIEAELCEVVIPSSQRREPPCPFFGRCGGCQWQHLSYAEQLHWKERIFNDLMVRSKVVAAERIKPIVPSPGETRYRNRVQLKCHFVEGSLALGFYRHGSHTVVDVDHCLLVNPKIQQTLELLRHAFPEMPAADTLNQVDIACGDDGEVRILAHVHATGSSSLRKWLQGFARRHHLNAGIQAGFKGTIDIICGEGDLVVSVDRPAIDLRYGPGGFAQVNSAQNRAMVKEMLALLNLTGDEKVLDLFCGMGNFSLPLARRARWVTGVEGYLPSIESARTNAENNQINNVEFHAADVPGFMTRYAAGDLDLVVLDPPRSGNYQAAAHLLTLRPQRILYVSCDPATLARDIVPLVEGGYEVLSSQPFDLFPQTWHIESMTLLQRARS